MNLLRRIASLPGLRRVLLRPAVRRRLAALLMLRFALAARRVTAPWTLLREEYLRRRGHVGRYVIAATGVPVVFQHGRDLEALFEIFERGEYDPPSALAGRLRPDRVQSVLDVGANVGMFSAWATGAFPGARITAFEPSSESIPLYRSWASGQPHATLIEACAAPADGHLHFQEGYAAGSRQVADGEISVEVDAVDVLPHLAEADFAKIDIEGGEWAILSDPRMSDLSRLTLVMEYHRHLAPSLPAADAARALLEQAGFSVGHVTPNHWGHGTLWAWKD